MWSNLFANLTVVGSIHAIPPTATGVTPGSNVFVFSNTTGRSMLMDSSGKVGIGTLPTVELDVSGNVSVSNTVFIGNTFWTGTKSTNDVVGPATRLVFDNTTTPYAANKILLHSNTASANICGFGVVGVYDAVPMTLGYYTSGEHSFTVGANQNFGGTTAFTIRSTGSIDMNGNKRAKLDIGTYGMPSSNTTVRIDGSNVALVTSGSGLVGFGTTAPTANLHVIGNVYVSNAITATNVFATRYYGDGGMLSNVFVQSLANLVVSNSVTTTNVFATTANVGTLNVWQISNLSSLSLTTANVSTLNVWQVSNLSTLTVTNNLYAANVFATAGASIGPSILGTNVFVFSNTSGGSNVLIMNNLGRVGIATKSPGYPLDVGTTVSIAASGNETIRSKGPVIIGNGTNDGNRFISALDSSMVGGDSRYFVLGKAGSIYNQAELSYYHDADGSTNNKMYLGFFSKIVMTLAASGNVGIGTLVPSANVHVIGNVYASNAVTTTNVIAATVSTTNPISFRNRVINGDFLIDQRNAGASSTPAAGATRTIDRWKTEIFGSGRCLVGQNLGGFALPAGFSNCYGMKVTTTTSVGAGDYFFLSQVIEGVNTIDWGWGAAGAKPITLSFWVFSSIAGTAGGFVRNAGSTAGNYTRSYPFTFAITNTLTWEYKTITIPGDTTGQWLTGQTDGVEFGIELWNGSTYQSAPGAWAAGNYTGPSGGTINYAGTLNSNMNITGVQIELGNVATQFERRLYNFEIAACQRYYETTTARVGGYNTNGAYFRGSVYFNTKKRTVTPTLTVVSILETSNVGTLNFDNSNFDGSSARYLVPLTSTGDAYGQWKVSVDCEF